MNFTFQAESKAFEFEIELINLRYNEDGVIWYDNAQVMVFEDGELVDELDDSELYQKYGIDVSDFTEGATDLGGTYIHDALEKHYDELNNDY